MVFDTIGTFITLVSVVLSKHSLKPTAAYSYGYDRIEILSGFTNSIFFMFVSMFIVFKSIESIFSTPSINTDPIISIAMCGIVLNSVGILFFPKYSHMRSESRSSHVEFSQRVQKLFIDNLPHLGAILSSLLIQSGWAFFDPILAFFILAKVLRIAVPFARDTGRVLLQATPSSVKDSIYKTIREASTAEGVLEIKNEHFWTQSPGVVIGSLVVRVRSDANEQTVLSAISPLFSRLVSHLTIQIEKSDWTLDPNKA